jgi:tyrosyl-tRNA synthetase
MNVSDDDAKRYIKIFTSLTREEIEALIAEHDAAPHLRVLQKRLAKEVTIMVHSEEDYNAAVEASNILFGNATAEALRALDEETFLQVFEGVERYEISLDELKAGIAPLDLLAEKTAIFPSKGEARKMIQANGFSMNKEKLTDPATPLTDAALLNGKYLLFQKGKKNYYLVVAK